MKTFFTKFILYVLIPAAITLCIPDRTHAALFIFQNQVTNPADTSYNPLIVSDTLENDTIRTMPQDTVKLRIPTYKHGSLYALPYYHYKAFSKNNIQYDNYTSLSDLLRHRMPSYPLLLGAFGQFNSLSVNGGRPTDLAIRYNNRMLIDPEYNSFNMEIYPVEFLEKAEFMTGSDAVIFSDFSSGALVNLIEPRYNTKKPFTRIWYSQAGYNYLGGDGIFSHNFARDWNFTFGFRRQSWEGNFANNYMDSWNIRGLIRWSPSDRTTISITENFANHTFGSFGGIDTLSQYYLNSAGELVSNYNYLSTTRYAIPEYSALNQRNFRHDLTLTFTSLLGDSITGISGNMYFTHNDWDWDLTRELMPDTLQPYEHSYINRQYGGNLRYEQSLTQYFTLRTGGEANNIYLEDGPFHEGLQGLYLAGYGHGEINLLPYAMLTGGVRVSSLQEHQQLAFGAKSVFMLDTVFSLVLDVSRSQRMPSPVEGLALENEENLLAIGELSWRSGNNSIAVNAYGRKTNSPIKSMVASADTLGRILTTKAYNGSPEVTFGGQLSTSFEVMEHLFVSTMVQTNINTIDGKRTKRYPLIYGTFSSHYEYTRGRSLVAAGFTYTYLSSFEGERFIPFNRSYISTSFESRQAWKGLDVFVFGRLGNAFIKATYQNVLSETIYYVPIYPQLDRNIRLSIGWSFLD